MADILQEVDEAMRAEKWAQFWHEHKTAIIVGVAAIILGTASLTAWRGHIENKNRAGTSAIFNALEQKDSAAALARFEKNTPANLQAISLLNAGAIESKAGNLHKAAKLYEEAANIKTAQDDLKDLARLQWVSLSIDDTKTDSKTLLDRLSAITVNQKSPWQDEAVFMSAFVKGEKDKKYKAATDDLKKLSEKENAPPSLKQRAAALASLYTNMAGDQK